MKEASSKEKEANSIQKDDGCQNSRLPEMGQIDTIAWKRTKNLVEDSAVDVTDTSPENEVESASKERNALQRRVVNNDLQRTQVSDDATSDDM